MRQFLIALTLMFAMAACSPVARDELNPDPIAEFRLGHVSVVAPDPLQSPVSRDATGEEWVEVLKPIVQERLRRFEGAQFYHIGVHVRGFALAPPGIPLIASPKSLLILDVIVIEDSTGEKLTDEPHQIVVGEGVSAETMVSSGLTRSRQRQMQILSERAAGAIEAWLRQTQDEAAWFDARQ